eukprot:maker-scaffold537_size144400-snap-gene-0.25 protein:Tk08652 transcript:maker-scaffold537_size144400-snap-gene-0.25-mRNA-1 annotation:"PREDICTED: nardilysin-like"
MSPPTPTEPLRILATPAQSPSDRKAYRTIELSSGLKALLISDTTYPLAQLDEEEKEMDQADDDEEASMEEGSEDEDEESMDESDGDPDEEGPKSKSLSGLKPSAAGLCIGVGSFSDPSDLPGLAHFLEHMVFMGSEKYPDENSFDAFIQKHGGYDNAHTDCETTVFHFECQRKSFKEGLDRFAQFFIAPLMKSNAMCREREAVDSEFEMALPSDSSRVQQIFATLAKSGHPMGKFMWGNSKSLQSPKSDDAAVHKTLHAFKDRHYTSQSMTLVVQAQEELDTLQDWVIQSFASVPNNQKAREEFGHMTKPFDTPHFHRLYKVAPIKDVYRVDLNWALPSLLKDYRVKPLHYLSWVIGHEGRGSLISYLRKKVWALSLMSGNAGDGFEHNSTYSIFNLSIILTKEGFENVDKVVQAAFAYLDMLHKTGPNERIYKEIQKIEDLHFKFGEEKQPNDNVETLCENMQLYPPELYLTGDELMFEYNQESIQKCLDHLGRDNVNIFLMAKEFKDQCKQVEEWFKTKYASEKIPALWKTPLEPIKELHVPEPNLFIAEDLTMKEVAKDLPRFPRQIKQEPVGELYYRPDDIFKQPRAFINFHLISPLPLESSRNSACLDLMMSLICQAMVEDTYPADLAQLEFSLYGSERGVVLKICGLNDKLKILLEEMLKHLMEFSDHIKEDFFNAVKAQNKKGYYNTFIKPMKLVKSLRMDILQDRHHGSMARHAIVSQITMTEIKDFAKAFSQGLYIQGLVQGNLDEKEALEMYELVKTKVNPKAFDVPELRCCTLPSGAKILRVGSLNPMDGNTAVTNYYQYAPGDLKSYVSLEVANKIMEEPVFDKLRTQEQLGYQVFSMLRNTFGVLGLSITVCAQASKFAPDHVDERIEKFFQWLREEKLKTMANEEFQEMVQSLIKVKKTADVTLKEETDRNWGEVCSKEYLFDRCGKEIEILEKVTQDEVIQIMEDLFGSKYKKLSVQIVGNENAQSEDNGEDTAQASPSLDGPFELTYLEDGDKFIKDVSAFRSALEVNPVLRITK